MASYHHKSSVSCVRYNILLSFVYTHARKVKKIFFSFFYLNLQFNFVTINTEQLSENVRKKQLVPLYANIQYFSEKKIKKIFAIC